MTKSSVFAGSDSNIRPGILFKRFSVILERLWFFVHFNAKNDFFIEQFNAYLDTNLINYFDALLLKVQAMFLGILIILLKIVTPLAEQFCPQNW